MLEGRQTMRLAIGVGVLLALLGFVQAWRVASGGEPISVPMLVLVLGGLCGGAAALAVRAWLRKRYRRRLLNMRGSALW
jgi:hypothetical protein